MAAEKIYVAGHRGMVGSAIVRALEKHGLEQIITRSHQELDLRNQAAVRTFFQKEKPTQVYLAAARVGGIYANNAYPADFIYDNLMIEANLIEAAFGVGVKKLLFLGSSCIYPREVTQPMAESALLSAKLEPTNEPYALAKIAGIKLCESFNRQYQKSHGIDYRSVMPCNLYGVGDNYHLENSHVIPALIRRFHEAKVAGEDEVKVWGTGKIRREFLYVDDLAEACLHVMALPFEEYIKYIQPMCSHLNVGYGDDVTIAELADLVASVIGFKGQLLFDADKPDGPPRKFIDSSKINALGWHPNVSLQEGLKLAYEDFLKGCLHER